ncbi:MAG TPA: ATP-binding protein [Acidobacteriota bacterium]|nr:ATP-binding protein [Acidobacteriota bacterium]
MSRSMRDWLKYSSILVLIVVISGFHYGTSTDYLYLHEIYQRIYYIPILLAAFWYGPWGGVLAASLTSALYVYHIQAHWAHFPSYTLNQYAEIILYHVIAVIIGFLSQRERRQRERLEAASQELSRAYDQIQQTFDQLRQSDRLAALGQLSAGVAHEIRNPLGSIKGSIEILESEFPADHPKREFVDIIKEETSRLNNIVAAFLKFARPASPSMQLTSVGELIDSTLTLLKKEAEASRVNLEVHHASSLPAIRLDPDQIRQVLLNIVLNGIQAMPAGGRVEVRSSYRDSDRSVIIEVSDTGNGQPPEDLDQLFDPFYTTKPHGTGLGLSISYQLVHNHKGNLTVRRNDQGGLTFGISLPL